ncbi:helix-turn-helix transcriptional regulator [Clostridiaceae bacterium HSG29]|nr:helix-turn-helix transcriptional regulator [Clostridiaceae bacterium HSG29]
MKRINELRKELGLTQNELGKKVGLSGRAIGNYETGHRDPDTETLTKLANYFEVTTDYLLERTNQKYFKQDETIAFHTDKKLTDKDLKTIRNIIDAYIDGIEKKER